MDPLQARTVASILNDECDCVVMDEAMLDDALLQEGSDLRAGELIRAAPHLFSRSSVFVDARAVQAMRAVVAAVERIVQLPAYQALALRDAHPHARLGSSSHAVCMGFDFHLAEAGPGLIEINTNAGGGLLNGLLRRAQKPCCSELLEHVAPEQTDHAQQFFDMFLSEWRRARGNQPLTSVAIVDDAPESQFLYHEFKLFVHLCQARGIVAQVCDARDLSLRDGSLWGGGQRIDLVYNRLTDFIFEQPEHAALLEAYRSQSCVITPHPRAHALYADKRRLVILSDPEALLTLGALPEDAALLGRHIPRTRLVHEADREQLWQGRKELFFKPHSGYGGKAAYRGDKLTRGVFEHVLAGGYVAQALVPPSSRVLCVAEERKALKVDIRCFAYDGQVQLICARLYSGQTTNFRTAGGGFAPVYVTSH